MKNSDLIKLIDGILSSKDCNLSAEKRKELIEIKNSAKRTKNIEDIVSLIVRVAYIFSKISDNEYWQSD